jgi:hypothetical protein
MTVLGVTLCTMCSRCRLPHLQAGIGVPVLQDSSVLQHLNAVYAGYGGGIHDALSRLAVVRLLAACEQQSPLEALFPVLPVFSRAPVRPHLSRRRLPGAGAAGTSGTAAAPAAVNRRGRSWRTTRMTTRRYTCTAATSTGALQTCSSTVQRQTCNWWTWLLHAQYSSCPFASKLMEFGHVS